MEGQRFLTIGYIFDSIDEQRIVKLKYYAALSFDIYLDNLKNMINLNNWQYNPVLSSVRKFNHANPELLLRDGSNVENLTEHVCSKSRVQQLDGLILRAKQYETLTWVDLTCKGYPVKKATSHTPQRDHVCPLLWETLRKHASHPLRITLLF